MKQFEFCPTEEHPCRVTAYIPENPEGISMPAVVVCPGGGYRFVADGEGTPVARMYAGAGFAAFVLEYSVGEKAGGFRPLLQLAAAVAYIRTHCRQWNVDPHKIAVCGFSAGGHLAASLGVLFHDEKFMKACPDLTDIRPDALILGYPLISSRIEDGNGEIFGALQLVAGNAPVGSDAYHYFGLDTHVDAQTPPAFLWHTAQDAIVPVVHSTRFAAALYYAGVPVELHILPDGYHGMSLCTDEVGTPHPYNSRWTDWSIAWLNKIFTAPYPAEE